MSQVFSYSGYEVTLSPGPPFYTGGSYTLTWSRAATPPTVVHTADRIEIIASNGSQATPVQSFNSVGEQHSGIVFPAAGNYHLFISLFHDQYPGENVRNVRMGETIASVSAGSPPDTVATGAVAGTPGYFTPQGATVPYVMTGIVPDPSTKWTEGQWINGYGGTDFYWDGTQWKVGVAPGDTPPPPVITATHAVAGTPGYYNPAGAKIPQTLGSVSPSPSTAWVNGQYVRTSTGQQWYWDGTRWVQGTAPNVAGSTTPTNAVGGTPGQWLPSGSLAPGYMPSFTPNPSTAWTAGQYVLLSNGAKIYWNGASWQSGAAPGTTTGGGTGGTGVTPPSGGFAILNSDYSVATHVIMGRSYYLWYGSRTFPGYWVDMRAPGSIPAGSVTVHPEDFLLDSREPWIQHGEGYVRSFTVENVWPGPPSYLRLRSQRDNSELLRLPAYAQTPTPTGAVAGKPGYYTPIGATSPATLVTITPSPSTMWGEGQYIVMGGNPYFWDGNSWVAGESPGFKTTEFYAAPVRSVT